MSSETRDTATEETSAAPQVANPSAAPAAPEGRNPPAGGGAQQAPPQDAAERGGGAGEGASAEDAGVAEIEGDLEELVDIAAQRDEYLALAQRTQADFENYRRRVARESALAQERGAIKLVRELLPALDNLDRALDSAAQEAAQETDGQRPAAGRPQPSRSGPGRSAEDSHLLQGVRLVREELSAALTRVGIESFSPVGEVFDPSLHEAVAHQPRDGAASGTVAEVYQPGYRLGEQIIRPARVVVAA